MLWTNKYIPKTISEVVGQDDAILQMKDFIVNFKRQKRKAAMLFGPVGCGKSSSVYALANDIGCEIFEVNASDIRNEEAIYSTVGSAIKQKSIFFKEKIILVDELDGISGRKDFGGISAMCNLIKETSVPIVLISNEPWDEKLIQLRKLSRMIEFKQLGSDSIYSMLKRICENEGLEYEEDALKMLVRKSAGDLRAAINDLQTIATNGKLLKEHIEDIYEREKKEKINEALLRIFKTTDMKIAMSAFDYVDEDFNKLILWIDENLPKEYESEDLKHAYDYLSLADIYNRRIKRRQDWRYLFYINMFLTAGIALSKHTSLNKAKEAHEQNRYEKYQKVINYNQTKRVLKIWIANQRYAKRKAIAEKISESSHCSTKKATEIIPYMQLIFKKNKKLAELISNELGLGNDERRWLEN